MSGSLIDTEGMTYHLYCEVCSKSWWSQEAFPSECRYCGVSRETYGIVKKNVAGTEHTEPQSSC